MAETMLIGAYKKAFFDRDKLAKLIHGAQVRGLSRTGAYCRGVARRSIRRPPRSGKAAPPGEPPYGPTGKLKASILFAHDEFRQAVVVGPYLFAGKKNRGATCPEDLEYGVIHNPHPFMRPAQEVTAKKMPEFFAGSLTNGPVPL